MVQGDVVKSDAAVKRVAQRHAGPTAPWTLNADIQEDDEPEDSESRMDELSDGQQEFVPYCVMPYVERLLQVSRISHYMPACQHGHLPLAQKACCPEPIAVHFDACHRSLQHMDIKRVLYCAGVHGSDAGKDSKCEMRLASPTLQLAVAPGAAYFAHLWAPFLCCHRAYVPLLWTENRFCQQLWHVLLSMLYHQQ